MTRDSESNAFIYVSCTIILNEGTDLEAFRYCECFSAGVYCDGCNCMNCQNNEENEPTRKFAVRAILERNPDAFRPKIATSPHGLQENAVCIFL